MLENFIVFVFVFILFAFIVGYGYYNKREPVASGGGSAGGSPPSNDGNKPPTPPPPSKPEIAIEDDYDDPNSADNEFDDPNASRAPSKRVVAYYTNWARYREDAPCLPKDIPTSMITDIVYAFFPVNDEGLVRYSDPWSDINLKGISETVALRGTGKVKRVLFSIGGWTYSGPDKKKWYLDESSKEVVNEKPFLQIWDEILSSKSNRGEFISSAIEMMERHDFDGIDIDYEYPACPQGDCQPKYKHQSANFVNLLAELRERIGPKKLITLATAAADKNILYGPDMKRVSEIVDYLNVMTYDYFVWLEGGDSGHNQPKRNTSDGLSVNHTLWRYMKLGCDPQKLNIGVACYGRGFQISKPDFEKAVLNRSFSGIKSIGSSHPSKWTQENGVTAFYEFQNEYPKGKSIYIKNQGSWLYDSATSEIMSYTDLLDLKSLNEIRIRKKIGGILIYALDQDDYANFNGFGRYPLIRNMINIDALKPSANMISA